MSVPEVQRKCVAGVWTTAHGPDQNNAEPVEHVGSREQIGPGLSRPGTAARDPIRKCAAPLADRPHARSWGYSAVARGRSEGVVFGSEHVDRGETRLRCDAVPKVNCKADVAGPKGIPSAAND